MFKKGMALETIIKAVLLLVVLFIIISVFRSYFGKEVGIVGTQISSLEHDTDCDGVVDYSDKCPYDYMVQKLEEGEKCEYTKLKPRLAEGCTASKK